MFLKRLERRKNGKKHTYWALVESIRTERGSRHRIVSYLGELTKCERGGSYIVGTPKATLRRFEQYLTDRDWPEVQAGVEVKLVPGPDGDETFILARSADRQKKEKAMHDRFLERMEAGLIRAF